MTNPFEVIQEMVEAQRETTTAFVQLRGLLVSMEQACFKNQLAPTAQKQMQSLREQGLALLEELFLKESRHNISEKTSEVSAQDIMDSIKKQKVCEKCQGSGKMYDPSIPKMVECDICKGSGQVSA
jgi:DnaJ-class molecular chaperone